MLAAMRHVEHGRPNVDQRLKSRVLRYVIDTLSFHPNNATVAQRFAILLSCSQHLLSASRKYSVRN